MIDTARPSLVVTAPDTKARAAFFGKLARVLGAMDTVPMRGWNEEDGYAFAYEADVLDVLRPVLARENIAVLWSVLRSERSYAGGRTKCLVWVSYMLADGDNGAMAECVVEGEGHDAGDKALYKAYTGAGKNWARRMFLIATGDDPESTPPNGDRRGRRERGDGAQQARGDAMERRGADVTPHAVTDEVRDLTRKLRGRRAVSAVAGQSVDVYAFVREEWERLCREPEYADAILRDLRRIDAEPEPDGGELRALMERVESSFRFLPTGVAARVGDLDVADLRAWLLGATEEMDESPELVRDVVQALRDVGHLVDVTGVPIGENAPQGDPEPEPAPDVAPAAEVAAEAAEGGEKAPPAGKPITAAQNSRFWAVAQEHGWTPDEAKHLLEVRFGAKTTRGLVQHEASYDCAIACLQDTAVRDEVRALHAERVQERERERGER